MQTEEQAEINVRRYAATVLRRLKVGGPEHRAAAKRLAAELDSLADASAANRTRKARRRRVQPEVPHDHAA
jgi:hypothetical protein